MVYLLKYVLLTTLKIEGNTQGLVQCCHLVYKLNIAYNKGLRWGHYYV